MDEYTREEIDAVLEVMKEAGLAECSPDGIWTLTEMGKRYRPFAESLLPSN